MKNRLGLHLLFWLSYGLLETYFEFAWIRNSLKHLGNPGIFAIAFLTEMAQLPAKVFLVYGMFWLLVQKEIHRFSWLLIALLLLFLFVVSFLFQRLLIVYFLLPVFYAEKPQFNLVFDLNRMNSSIGNLFFIAGLAFAAKQYRNSERNKEQKRNAQKEKLMAELLFLRNQTHPHFLFNTLNNIYALARKKSDKTAEVVLKLSQLVRFMLYESRRDQISIGEEVKVIEDYIDLEKIRYQGRLQVGFEREIDHLSEPIAPLILLPFVENAFKHGAGESRFDVYVHLFLRLYNGLLYFRIENSKEDPGTTVQENIGLGNVRRQLQLTYSDFDLQIDNQSDKFVVDLRINLRKNVPI